MIQQLIIHLQEIKFCWQLQNFKIINSTSPASTIKKRTEGLNGGIKNQFTKFSNALNKALGLLNCLEMHKERNDITS